MSAQKPSLSYKTQIWLGHTADNCQAENNGDAEGYQEHLG